MGYEMVDKHIRRLDGDLAKFEAELREKGRLSQTDDSDEDEEEEEERSVGKKGSRKKQGKDKEKDAKYKKQKVGRPPKEEVGKDKEKKKSKKGSGNNKEEKVKLSATPLMNMPQEIIDMPVDPNDCPIEWFHFGCMQLTTKPKGKWYCPKCIVL